MSMFGHPGAAEAIKAWNEARAARASAQKSYLEAQERNWQALVRVAQAHKAVVEAVGPEHAHLFLWLESLDGNRDQILDAAIANVGGAK